MMPSPTRSRTPVATVLTAVTVAAVGVVGAGCADSEPGDNPAPRAAPVSSSPTTSPSTTRRDPPKEETRMRIQITIGEQRFSATLAESAAARDLGAQLPVTIDMSDHGGVEKTGPLPSPLSLDGQPE